MIQTFLPNFYEGLRICRCNGFRYSSNFLRVNVQKQKMSLYCLGQDKCYHLRKTYLISTSAFGTGCLQNSKKTPLGLHRIARKIGGGYPQGTIFKGRIPVKSNGTFLYTWRGMPKAKISNRILWLEGLEFGKNKGGNLDTFKRYVYIHGVGDELTLGKPASSGCIHVAGAELLPLYEKCNVGDLVWIEER